MVGIKTAVIKGMELQCQQGTKLMLKKEENNELVWREWKGTITVGTRLRRVIIVNGN